MRSLLLVALMLGVGHAHEAQSFGEARIAFLLPTRRGDAAALDSRLQRVAMLLAQRLALPAAVQASDKTPSLGLSPRIERARSLFLKADMDQAAAALDAVVEDGRRAPHRLADAEEMQRFIGAEILRASIALARGEDERATDLLGRLLRADPGTALLDEERSPPLERALAAARRRLGAAEPRSDDLGDACSENTLVLVGRSLGGHGFEIRRFDNCMLVAKSSELDDEKMVASLAAVPAAHTSELRTTSPPTKRPVYKKGWFWATLGLTVLASGAVVAGAVVGTRNQNETLIFPHYPR
jgi:hypothetical protein